MLEILYTGQFKKDFKLISKRNYDLSKLELALNLLVSGEKLPSKYKEHPLSSNFKGYLDCHIEPDWLLIYKKDIQENLLTLVRTGTHSDIFR